MIPYADIARSADRRWTLRLLDRLEVDGLSDEELDDLVGALNAVSDPRCVTVLEAILVDSARPAKVREAAGDVLLGMDFLDVEVPEEKIRSWWHKGDALLRRHALSCMDALDCPDIVLQAAADPAHEHQAQAIDRMVFFFEEPGHQQIKIRALSHPDPRVRAAAAGVLFWDEPVAAELPLIAASRDPVPEVATEAANTLQYYPSLRVIRRLHELSRHADETVRQQAQVSFGEIRFELRNRLRDRDRQVARHVLQWLRPVWDLLAFAGRDLRPDKGDSSPGRRERPGKAMPVADLLALLAEPEASPRTLSERLWSNPWRAYRIRERRQLRPVLLSHPEALVREPAARAFAAWQDAGALLELVRDPDSGVRKSAMYNLGQLPPTPSIAGPAWEHLHRHDTLGTHATETLATFVRHASPEEAVRRLGWIAADHGRREGLRDAAVYALTRLGAAEEVGQLVGLLHEPPAVTWALHLALLDAIVKLGLPAPDLEHLREVDNLHVQAAVARVEA